MANAEIKERTTTVNDRSSHHGEGPSGLEVLFDPALNKSTAFIE